MSPQRQQDRTGSSVALIACDVFQPEIEVLRKDTPIARVDYLEMNLHDQPAVLAGTLQEKVDNCENDPAVDTSPVIWTLRKRSRRRRPEETVHPRDPASPRLHHAVPWQ